MFVLGETCMEGLKHVKVYIYVLRSGCDSPRALQEAFKEAPQAVETVSIDKPMMPHLSVDALSMEGVAQNLDM